MDARRLKFHRVLGVTYETTNCSKKKLLKPICKYWKISYNIVLEWLTACRLLTIYTTAKIILIATAELQSVNKSYVNL